MLIAIIVFMILMEVLEISFSSIYLILIRRDYRPFRLFTKKH